MYSLDITHTRSHILCITYFNSSNSNPVALHHDTDYINLTLVSHFFGETNDGSDSNKYICWDNKYSKTPTGTHPEQLGKPLSTYMTIAILKTHKSNRLSLIGPNY